MTIYNYGIIDTNGEVSDTITGLEGARVYNISYRDIGIVVSELSEGIQDITKEHILKHEEVVEKLMEDFTVLPVKFPTLFKQKEDILLMAKEYYTDFRENLDRLHNKVEFGIKVIWPADIIRKRIIDAYVKSNASVIISGDSPGKSFVKEKFEEYKIDKEFEEEATRCITAVDDVFSRFAIEKKLEKLKSKSLLLNAYYLLEKEKQSDFKKEFERVRATEGDLKYLLSGPWPPYNFIILTKKSHPLQNFSGADMLDR